MVDFDPLLILIQQNRTKLSVRLRNNIGDALLLLRFLNVYVLCSNFTSTSFTVADFGKKDLDNYCKL